MAQAASEPGGGSDRQIPPTLADLTPAYLTTALQSSGHLGDAYVLAVAAEPAGQERGYLGQLARLRLQYDRPAPDAPLTMFAKMAGRTEQGRRLAMAAGWYATEVRFYQELAAGVPLRTPACYYAAVDPAARTFLLLLEDCSDARAGEQLAGCSPEDAELVMREIAALHAAWWEAPRLAGLTWVPSVQDPRTIRTRHRAWSVFMERCGDLLPPALRRHGAALVDRLSEAQRQFADSPLTLCHGDFRLDNLFFGPTPGAGPLIAVDWQLVRRVVGTYDVALFLSQSLAVETSRANAERLLRLYHDTLAHGGVRGYSYDRCVRDFRWILLSCLLYVIVTATLADPASDQSLALLRTITERNVAAITDWRADQLLDKR